MNASIPLAAWLESGAAIARRVAHVLNAEKGVARARIAAFTADPGALNAAFRARGFSELSRIGAAPDFEAPV